MEPCNNYISRIYSVLVLKWHISLNWNVYCQLRARMALVLFKDVLLRTRRVLLQYKAYGNSTLLVLKGTSLNSVSSLLDLNQWNVRSSHSFWRCNRYLLEARNIFWRILFNSYFLIIILWIMFFPPMWHDKKDKVFSQGLLYFRG